MMPPSLFEGPCKERSAYWKRKKRLTQKTIDEFERKYGMTSAEFMSEFELGKLGDSRDYFEWWGFLRGKRAIEEEIKKAKAVLTS